MNKEQKKIENWQAYVDEMKDQNQEQYLAGDLEGYRRGYSHGREVEREKQGQEKTDLTLAGMFMVAVIAGALGIFAGLVAAAL